MNTSMGMGGSGNGPGRNGMSNHTDQSQSNGMPGMNMSSGGYMGATYGNMAMPPIPHSPLWSPRITPEVYVAIQFLMMAISLVTAGARTYLRIRKFRRVTLDDLLLMLAVCFEIVGVSVSYQATSMAYWSVYVDLGLAIPPDDWADMLLSFSIIDNIADIFGWGAIFIVKISFLLFLRSLVTRVRLIHTWWWIVFGVVASSTPVTMFLGFFICPDFTATLQRNCQSSVIARQFTFLTVNCVLDILSDVLILTIPCWLLWKVQISLRRKIALGTVLCLSVFMISIAVIRVALDRIIIETGAEAPDTVWLYFWTNMEGSVAIIMVSLTAFRSMLGQDGVQTSRSSKTASDLDSHYSAAAAAAMKSSTRTSSTSRTTSSGARSATHHAAPRYTTSISHAPSDSDSAHDAVASATDPDTAPPWTDARLNSIRKEITIRTDYEPITSPRPLAIPSRNGQHVVPHPYANGPGSFLATSSTEDIV